MNWSLILQVIIGGLISAFIAIAFVIWMENLRKPKLTLRTGKPAESSYTNRPAKSERCLRLVVENKKLPWYARCWLSRNAAVRCYGFINFNHLDGQDVFGRDMSIKWSNLPGRRLFPDGRAEAYPFEFVKYIDIHAGYTEKIDVAARYDDDAECFGWCYDNYFSDPPWRNPDWKLRNERYLVKVEIICAGGRCIDLFRLINDVPVNAFRLENAQQDDYDKLGIKRPKRRHNAQR